MTLADRLRAVATAPADADLAEVLGVRAADIRLEAGDLVVGGERITLAEAHRLLTPPAAAELVEDLEDLAGARIRIEDLDPCRPTNSAS